MEPYSALHTFVDILIYI